jgi:PAS domain S-box-containing protein
MTSKQQADSEDLARLKQELEMVRDQAKNAEKQLEHTEQLLQYFLDHNPALSFIKDEAGRYLYVSKSFLEFFKVSAEDVIGKTDLEWLPEPLARQFMDNDNQVRQKGKPLETVESVPTDNGTVHSIVHKFPITKP